MKTAGLFKDTAATRTEDNNGTNGKVDTFAISETTKRQMSHTNELEGAHKSTSGESKCTEKSLNSTNDASVKISLSGLTTTTTNFIGPYT